MFSKENPFVIYCEHLRDKDGNLEVCGNVAIPPHWKYCAECSPEAIRKGKAARQREKKYVQR